VILLGEPEIRVSAGIKASMPGSNKQVAAESVRSVQDELDKIATKLGKKTLTQKDGRFPMYVVFTSRTGLKRQFGQHGLSVIEQKMKQVVRSIGERPDWGSVLVYSDDQ
jgi:hypothetical protein